MMKDETRTLEDKRQKAAPNPANSAILGRRGHGARQRSTEMAHRGLIVDFSRGERYHPAMNVPFFEGQPDFDPDLPKSGSLSEANSPALEEG